MSEAKFTKGEWCLSVGGKLDLEITTKERTENNTVPVCELDVNFIGDIGDVQKANANLIAQAPAMYELLTDLAALMIVLATEDNSLVELGVVESDIQKLLAKARGE